MDPLPIITALKTAIDIAGTVKNVAKDVDLKTQTAELYDVIISLQSGVLDMQVQNSSLLQENNSLRQELMQVETWENEKSKYSLKEISPHVFVYECNLSDQGSEPLHWLCAKCYTDNKKSILQFNEKNSIGSHYSCHNCGSKICDHLNKKEEKPFVRPKPIPRIK